MVWHPFRDPRDNQRWLAFKADAEQLKADADQDLLKEWLYAKPMTPLKSFISFMSLSRTPMSFTIYKEALDEARKWKEADDAQ